MECETPIDEDYCEAWDAPYLRTPQLVSQSSSYTSPQFYIRVDLEFLSLSQHAITDVDNDDDDVGFDPNCFEGVTKTEHLWAPCNRLGSEKLSHAVISGMLSGMGVPVDRLPFLVEKISGCANKIADAAHNKGENILPMIVSASVLVDYEESQTIS